jgi:aryl-alcohol dehydrogenase-like predicted oxidoreductase
MDTPYSGTPIMNHRSFGTTGLRVSPLCYGAMSFGSDADPDTSRKLYDRCREFGINFFDCADVYASGRSEELLGEFIAPERDRIIITSKAFFPTDKSDPNARGASRRHLMLACEASLKRLGTDYIDVYFIHRFDDHTDLHETLRALDDLVTQGKVLYLGASNFAAWQVAKAMGISVREGWSKFCCIQPMYNLVKRMAEVELLPMAKSENLAVLPYSPLGGGLLTGKYSQGDGQGRLVENSMYEKRYGDPSVRLGGGARSGDGSHHRGEKSRAVGGFVGIDGHRDDSRVVSRNRRPLSQTAPCHGPQRRAGIGRSHGGGGEIRTILR